MTEKEFRWLRRADLIEIIYALQEREKQLQNENTQLKQKLAERDFMVSQAGSLAEISARIHGIFETAQATADEYLLLIQNQKQSAVIQTSENEDPEEDSSEDQKGGQEWFPE